MKKRVGRIQGLRSTLGRLARFFVTTAGWWGGFLFIYWRGGW